MGRYMNGKLTNCPNCGAPIVHSYNYNCNYCGTYLNNTDKSIEKIGDSDIRITEVEIIQSIVEHCFYIVIRAEACKNSYYYEEKFINDIYISGENIYTYKPLRFSIRIDSYIFYNTYYNCEFSALMDILKSNVPQLFKNHMYEITNKLFEKWNKKEWNYR